MIAFILTGFGFKKIWVGCVIGWFWKGRGKGGEDIVLVGVVYPVEYVIVTIVRNIRILEDC